MSSRVVLSLGANLGDRLAGLQRAVDRLPGAGVRPVTVSPVYETQPVGGPPQPHYLNIVLVARTDLPPAAVFAAAQRVEADLGRVRGERWAARVIDIDVVAYDDVVSADPVLTLPHPRAAERAFVLRPWLDVEPTATLPTGLRVADLVGALDGSGVRRCADLVVRVPDPAPTP